MVHGIPYTYSLGGGSMSQVQSNLNRRQLLGGMLAAAPAIGTLFSDATYGAEDKAVASGRIKQSICFWCFNTAGDKWDPEKTCQVAQKLACPAGGLIEPGRGDLLEK